MNYCNDVILFENGERLFLTTKERHRFKKVVDTMDTKPRIFCRMLYYTGCKVSEATIVFPDQLYVKNGHILLGVRVGNLSKRFIPLPSVFSIEISTYFPRQENLSNQPVWLMSRSTGWRIIKKT